MDNGLGRLMRTWDDAMDSPFGVRLWDAMMAAVMLPFCVIYVLGRWAWDRFGCQT